METTSTQSAVCPLREALHACPGHALVIGGPGSGKTTIALRKGLARIRQGLVAGQTILFLSFSRAAVTRVLDAAKTKFPKRTGIIGVKSVRGNFGLTGESYSTCSPYAAKLLEKSAALRAAVALRHPFIIVDEAQDTGDAAGRCIELLAPHSQIICLG